MSTADDLVRLRKTRVAVGYEERVRSQLFSWANGRPYHDPINDECCPDFSCCFPDLFEADEQKRWRRYRDWTADHPPITQ